MEQTDIQAHIVPSGSMKISHNGVLKAYLGSCVGLAIYDPHSGLGGLIHILLPEPVCSIPDSHRTSYASTGVPTLLNELISQGARKESMFAFLAGGALPDSSDVNDFSLHIGGRTLDIVIESMKTEGIPINRLEASGFTPSQLIFDISNGECSVQPILNLNNQNQTAGNKPDRDDIERIIKNIIPVPQLTLKIVRMISEEDYDIHAVANEIKKEQVLTAKALRMCNSSYFRPAQEIKSIDQAIIYLGNKIMLRIALTAQAEQMLTTYGRGYSLCQGGLYYHALGTARLCEMIATMHGRIAPDVAYTAGLLHDIGKVVLDQYIAEEQPHFYRHLMNGHRDSLAVENEMFDTDHTYAGHLLSCSWQLPSIYHDVIKFHHRPDEATQNQELVHMTYLADLLMHKFVAGYELEQIDPSAFESSIQLLGIKICDILDFLASASRVE